MNLRKSDVYLDICTQRDYLAPDGSCTSANAEQVLTNIKHVMAFARWAKVPTLSCVDVRRPDDVRGLPRPNCVVGTPGQRKVTCSVLPDRVVIDSDNCLCVPLDLLERHQQAILTKQHTDPFTNPKLDRLLTEMPSRRFVVFGVSLETSLRLLVLGLLLRQRRVALVRDACGYWSAAEADMALRQLEAKGCELITTPQIVETAVSERLRRAVPARRNERFVA